MELNAWINEFQGAVTVCDPQGIILEMNDKSAKTFEKDGGRELIGKNLFDCHSETSRTKLKAMIQERRTNSYTIKKNGIKKMIYQSPIYDHGAYAGFVEISLEIPFDMPHFVRG
jgi:transcriptional regulator with PAS, ATPase and Fis domain